MKTIQKREFSHDFSGDCCPGSSCKDSYVYTPVTFSVGIFQWLPKASGKGLKKSKVKYRVKGYTSNPELVYKRAGSICDILDSSHGLKWLECRKSETVR